MTIRDYIKSFNNSHFSVSGHALKMELTGIDAEASCISIELQSEFERDFQDAALIIRQHNDSVSAGDLAIISCPDAGCIEVFYEGAQDAVE